MDSAVEGRRCARQRRALTSRGGRTKSCARLPGFFAYSILDVDGMLAMVNQKGAPGIWFVIDVKHQSLRRATPTDMPNPVATLKAWKASAPRPRSFLVERAIQSLTWSRDDAWLAVLAEMAEAEASLEESASRALVVATGEREWATFLLTSTAVPTATRARLAPLISEQYWWLKRALWLSVGLALSCALITFVVFAMARRRGSRAPREGV